VILCRPQRESPPPVSVLATLEEGSDKKATCTHDILAGLAIPRSADWKAFESALERYCENYSGDYWNASAAPPEFRETRR
jgi:hypothetical protein